MDTVPLPTRVLRIDPRSRRQHQDVVRGKPTQGQLEEEEEHLQDTQEPLLVREQKGRTVMGRDHRQFHRRQAQEMPNVLTVSVEVIATLDTAGHIVGLATTTPAIPSIPQIGILPSVPAVPPFPSDLTVPAYPWPSGVPSLVTGAATSATSGAAEFSSTLAFNSTTSASPSSSHTTSTSRSSSSSSHSSASSTRSSTKSSSTSTTSTSSSLIPSSTAGGGGGGFADGGNTSSPSATAAVPASNTNSSPPLETPQVVGTVIGSLAGVALLLCLVLFLIRRHKQKQREGALQLTGDDHTDVAQPMTQNAARTSFVPPSFLNRFSGASRSTVDSSTTGERSFQRISGRKLPSAFSEGMTSEQFAAGRPEGTLSGASFYHDDKGFHGGPGVLSKDFGEKSKDYGEQSAFAKETGETANTGSMGTAERVRPSPARTPVIHHADDGSAWGTPRNGGDALSPPRTPNSDVLPPPRGTLGRSHPSRDGSRSSRFTENV